MVRPTGLLDPPVEVRKTEHQVDDLVEEIRKRADKDERILVTTLTKRMAEELDEYLRRIGIRVRYIHSDVDTAERVEIIEDFKNGLFDVLVGVNLLREGLDIPSVSLVAILDADKEGFLRTGRALTQTAGRAARNVNGLVIMYADKITPSMEETIRETNRRRSKQMEYNKLHNIVPRQVETKSNILAGELTSAKGKPVAKGLAGGTTGRYSAPNSYDDPTSLILRTLAAEWSQSASVTILTAPRAAPMPTATSKPTWPDFFRIPSSVRCHVPRLRNSSRMTAR